MSASSPRRPWPRAVLLSVVLLSMLSACAQKDAGDDTHVASDSPLVQETPTTQASAKPWFVDRTQDLGVDFLHSSGFKGEFFMPEIIGPGLAVFDADGDGRLDILAVNGLPSDDEPLASQGDRLYLQQADGRFVDHSEGSGLGNGFGMGCAVGDIDNDGDLDLYITRYGDDVLYRNRGDGTFDDITREAGIEVGGWSTSAGFFDRDNDGWLDLYVVRYLDYDASRKCSTQAGQRDYCGPLSFPGQGDVLLANRGGERFDDVTREAGLARLTGRGLGLALEDFDDDGDTDIYIANDGEANQLWSNLGDGRFEDRAVVSGVAVNLLGRREASMGIASGDIDGDGDLDIFLTHLQAETNTLYLGVGGGAYEDRVAGSGLGSSSLQFTGFGTALLDGDLDGDLDLVVANGKVYLPADAPVADAPIGTGPESHPLRRYDESDLLYVNNLGAKDLGKKDRPAQFSLHPSPGALDEATISRALAVADLEGDGDLDLVLSQVAGPLRILRNELDLGRRGLLLQVVDPQLNREAIGARVWLVQKEQTQMRTLSRTSSYLASSSGQLHFSLATDRLAADRDHKLEPLTAIVRWPTGEAESFEVSPHPIRQTLRRGLGIPTLDPAFHRGSDVASESDGSR